MSNNNDKDDDIITGEDLFDEPIEENLGESVEKDYSEQSKVKDAYKKAAAKKGRKKINKASYLSIGAILVAVLAVMVIGYSSGSQEQEQDKKGSGSVQGSKVSINTSKASQVKVEDGSRLAKATSEAEKHRLEKAQKSDKSALKTIQEVNQTEYVLVEEPEPEKSNPAEPEPVNTKSSKPRFRSLSPEQRDAQLSRLFMPLNGAALPFVSKSSAGGQGQLLQVAASKDIEKVSTFTEVSAKGAGTGEYELEGGGSPNSSTTRVNGSPVNQNASKPESQEVFADGVQQQNNNPKLGIHINYGEMFYGITRVEVNSDEPSFVWADVINGELRGARLHAKAAKFNGETVVIVFEKMVYKDKTYDVNIVALDPETKRSGIVDDIDRHPEKWLYFTLTALGEGFINAVSSTTTINGANGSVTTEEGVDDRRVAEATGANVFKRLLPTAESYLQVKNTIIAYEGREVIFYVASELNL